MASNDKQKKAKHPRITITELIQTKLYKAVDDPITDLRIEIARKTLDEKQLDKKLYDLVQKIWKTQAEELKIVA